MFTTTSSIDFNLVTARIVKQISVERQQQRSTTSRAAWHISATQGCTVFLTSRGSRVDSRTRTIPLTKTLRNASKETRLSLQASSEQWAYCKSETKRIELFKKWCPWQKEQENLWKSGSGRMDMQGVHAKVFILQYVLRVAHFSASNFVFPPEGRLSQNSSLPPVVTLSFKKNQERKKRRKEDVLPSWLLKF